MTRASKWAPFKRLTDWEGQRVRAKRDITNNGGATIKAGEECVVDYATVGKLHLQGPNAYVRMVDVSAVEAVNPPEPTAPLNQKVIYVAHWRDGIGVGNSIVEVSSAVFERRAKSWRRLGENGSPWSYKTVFSGEQRPGYLTAEEAVQALLDRTRANIEHKEKTLEYERRRLKAVEDYLKGLRS